RRHRQPHAAGEAAAAGAGDLLDVAVDQRDALQQHLGAVEVERAVLADAALAPGVVVVAAGEDAAGGLGGGGDRAGAAAQQRVAHGQRSGAAVGLVDVVGDR